MISTGRHDGPCVIVIHKVYHT